MGGSGEARAGSLYSCESLAVSLCILGGLCVRIDVCGSMLMCVILYCVVPGIVMYYCIVLYLLILTARNNRKNCAWCQRNWSNCEQVCVL